MQGVRANSRVSVMRYTLCLNPHDANDKPHYLPECFTRYVCASVLGKHSLFRGTKIDVEPFVDVETPRVDHLLHTSSLEDGVIRLKCCIRRAGPV